MVVNKVREGGLGYNAATNKYEDLLAAGVVDPAKVTRSALQNAASIAVLLLTTEALIAEKPEKGGGGPPAGGGGMGEWAAAWAGCTNTRPAQVTRPAAKKGAARKSRAFFGLELRPVFAAYIRNCLKMAEVARYNDQISVYCTSSNFAIGSTNSFYRSGKLLKDGFSSVVEIEDVVKAEVLNELHE